MLKKIILLAIGIFLTPSLIFAATTFRMDMDANTAGYQSFIDVTPGATFTSNIEIVMDGVGDSLSSFGYSVWWDIGELNTPSAGDISTSLLDPTWIDLSYSSITSPNIVNFSQINFGGTSGPYTGTVATINWTAYSPVTNASLDINLGFFDPLDGAYDGGGSSITPTFQGGTVNLVPEPISSILFLTGGAALGFRRIKKRKKE